MRAIIVGLGARMASVGQAFKNAKPVVEFTAYCDPSPAGLDALGASAGDHLTAYGDVRTMLASERPDMLFIGSPNFLHIEHLEAALRSDVPHIFCEKPLVISEEETFRLRGLLRAHDGLRRVMVGLVLRYSELYRTVETAKKKGWLGDIVSIEASEHIGPHHGAFFLRDWRRHTARSGGFMLEKCCHDLDLYQSLAGARPAHVASFGGRKSFVPEARPPEDFRFPTPERTGRGDPFEPRWGGSSDSAFTSDGDIVDYQTAIVEYENGVNLSFHTNINVPDEFRRFAVIGTRGMAEGDFNRNYLRIHDARTGDLRLERNDLDSRGANHDLADQAMARDLAASLDRECELPVTAIDALSAGLTAIKIDQARTSRTVVDMTSTWQEFDSYGLS